MKSDEHYLADDERLQVIPGEELVEFSREGLILNMVGKDVLRRIFITFLDLLDTSIAVYEKNGDYSYGIFCPGKCQLMHMSSDRQYCMAEGMSVPVQEGQPSHGPCWREASKASIENRRPVDISCHNGINLYSVPIISNGEAIGSIIFGYGDTAGFSMFDMSACELDIAPKELKGQPESFKTRSPYAIEQAKRRLNTLAMLIGTIIERKLAEEALRKSEANLEQAQRIAQMGSWTWDIKSDRIEGSTEYYRMFGFERWGYITYNDFLAVLHPKDREPVKRAVQAALSGAAPYSIDYRIINPEGLVRVIHAEGEVLRDSSGQPAQMTGIIQDITERKRIEEELARSRDELEEKVRQRTSELQKMNAELESRIRELNKAEEKLRLAYAYNRSLIEASLDPLVTISPDGRITDVNKATEAVTGYPREYLIGTDFSNYFTEPEKAKEGYLTVFKEGSVKDYPLEIRHKDGHVTPVLYNASVYRDEYGKVIGVFAAARDITERRKMEAELRKARDELELKVEQRTRELRETRNYLESLIAYANAPIIVWDADFTIRQFNHAFERLSGYSAGEVIGKDLKMLFPPESVDESLGRIRDTLAGERWESVEIPILRKDGSVRIALWNSANIYDQNGVLLATIAQGQDITERKRAEEALLESESRHRQLLESLPQLVWTSNADGACDYVSPQWVNYTGIPKELQLGDRWLKQVHPEDRERVAKEWFLAYSKGMPYDIEYRLRRYDGIYRWFKVRATPIYDKSGNLVKWFGSNMDIDDLKRAEEALRESREVLSNELSIAKSLQQVSTRLIQENDVSSLYDLILDTAKEIMHAEYASIQIYYPERGANGELLLLGYRGFSEQAAKFWEIVDSNSKSPCGMALQTRQRVLVPDMHACSFLAGSKELEMFVKMGIRAIQSTPLISRSGVLLGMISTHWREVHEPKAGELEVMDVLARQAADIIERAKTEKEIANAKAQTEFYLDLMGHDINNMNQVAMGSLELAVMKLEQNGKLDASDLPLLKASIESLSSSSRLISNVQKLKSTSTGGISLQAVDAVKLMAEAISESGHKGRDISIEFSHDEKCIVKANALLKDVFANLINNSIKHSRPEKPLAIGISIRRAMHDGNAFCRIMVDDNGPGIPDDLKEKLFQRFSRGQTRARGSGLGLYLVKTLVEHYGGSISVEDRVQGDHTQGARFVIMLPALA